MATNSVLAEASCELCSKYFSDPRMLPCLHSFCYNCLVKHFDTEKPECTCPTCKEPFTMPSGKMAALPKDLRSSYIAEVAEYEEMVSGKSDISCDRCGNSDDKMDFKFCCTCCRCLCSWCTKDHMRCLDTRKHSLIDVGEKKSHDLLNSIPHKMIHCPLHSDEMLKFYCKSCSQLVCRDCAILSHSGHSYDRIEAVAESEKNALLPLLEEAASAASKLEEVMAQVVKATQNIQIKQKSVDEEINECFKVLQEALRSRKEYLLAKSSEVGLSNITALKLQHEEIKKLCDGIVRVRSQIKEALEVYMPAEVLSAKGPMTDKLNRLMKQFKACSLHPCKNEFFTTDVYPERIREEIEKFGVVTAGSHPGKSTASLYMPQAIKGKAKEIILTTRDVEGKPFGRGGEVVKAKMQLIGKDESIEGTVKDNKDGTYEISVTPQSVGEHLLSIMVGNEHIKSSPFLSSVRESRNYTSLSALQNYKVSSSPFDVAVNDNGEKLFVVNYGHHCIQVFNMQGNTCIHTIGTSGTSGTEKLQFYHPSAIAIRGDVIYVTKESNHRVQKITTSGEHMLTFGSNGSGEGQLSAPRGICIDLDGNIYISEYSNNRVSIFTADGSFSRFITSNMSSPWGVAFDQKGNLHVVNYSSKSVSMFSPEGNYISQYKGEGSNNNNNLQCPSGIAIDSEGYAFVSEYNGTSSWLHIFSPQYKVVKTIQGFSNAVGVALDKDGFVYVSDHNNHQVVKY